MSFFKKLFGTQTFAELRSEADSLFDEGKWADARMSYINALEKKKGASPSEVEAVEDRVAECLDKMARSYIAEADRLAEEGHIDLAQAELVNALETAATEEVVEEAQRKMDLLEKRDAKEKADLPEELEDDERWALLAGSWEEEQMDEYDEYGEPFREALLALHEGEAQEALDAFEEILDEAESPAYLWLEIARARAALEDMEGSEEALHEFLDALDDGEGGQARLSAHIELARRADLEGDEEAAIGELQEAIDNLPEDPRPFLALGRYLREKGHHQESFEVLVAADALLDETQPKWQVHQEMGLTKKAAGQDEEAMDYLERVTSFMIQLRRLDFPPETGVALAELYEKQGRLDRAADLYRGLAEGSDRANHLRYHREAGRLLLELELDEEARRMLTRALALVESMEQAKAAAAAEAEDEDDDEGEESDEDEDGEDKGETLEDIRAELEEQLESLK